MVENGLTSNFYNDSYRVNNNQTFNILYLSNLIISKGYLDIIKALKVLNREKIKYNCVFAGNIFKSPDDPYDTKLSILRKNFEKIISKMDNATYIGPVFDKEKIKLLKKSDIFLLPTYYVNEGQPISIIEAMAYGNAIISTPYRSIVDIFKHKKEGLLIEPKKPELIAEALIYLYNNKKILEKMKLNAHSTLRKGLREKDIFTI